MCRSPVCVAFALKSGVRGFDSHRLHRIAPARSVFLLLTDRPSWHCRAGTNGTAWAKRCFRIGRGLQSPCPDSGTGARIRSVDQLNDASDGLERMSP